MNKPAVYKVFNVDWVKKELISVEEWSDEPVEMPAAGIAFQKAFDNNDTVVVAFGSNHANNRLPASIANIAGGIASLKWNKKFSIPDFGIDSSGVFGTLSFSGKAAFVFVSWDSVYEVSTSGGDHFYSKDKVR